MSSAETLAWASDGHSTFAGALAYRVRPASEGKSTNPSDYIFLNMGGGNSIGGNDKKFEWVGSFNLLDLISAPTTTTTYNFDFVHKVGAWEGGSNFERLASLSSPLVELHHGDRSMPSLSKPLLSQNPPRNVDGYGYCWIGDSPASSKEELIF